MDFLNYQQLPNLTDNLPVNYR